MERGVEVKVKAEILNNPTLRQTEDGQRFVLVENMRCRVVIDGILHGVRVPQGFVTDFASIPRPFHVVFPKLGPYNRPATLHDWLYCTGQTSKGVADLAFLSAMESCGAKRWRREAMYIAVKYFGWPAWWAHREKQKRGI